MRILGGLIATATTLACGCVPGNFLIPAAPDANAPLVQSSLFTSPPPAHGLIGSSQRPATTSPESALAVDMIGRKIVAANEAIGMRPVFSTIGSSQPEIFHQGTTAVFITEGLVKLCRSEGQLAALLSVELARMVAERETLATPEMRNPEKRPPIAVAMGNSGQFSGLDQLHQEEIATLGADNRRPSKKFVPPEPLVLARGYLESAGYNKKELDNASPLLNQAERTFVLEKQFKAAGEAPAWTPR